jgi:phenylacetic acid degradation operon negative regulatory protein
MNRVNEIEKRVRKGEAYFHLGTAGGKILDEQIPLRKFENRRWDRLWRILIFDIEEKTRTTRDLLREKIRSLGFAKWQESVYVTPHPITTEINEYLKVKNLYPRCVCFEARKLGEESDEQIAFKIFNLSNLAKKYFCLLKRLKNLRTDFEKKKLIKNKALDRLKEIVKQYEEVLLNDPFLPKELLPEDWRKDKIREKIKELFYLLT